MGMGMGMGVGMGMPRGQEKSSGHLHGAAAADRGSARGASVRGAACGGGAFLRTQASHFLRSQADVEIRRKHMNLVAVQHCKLPWEGTVHTAAQGPECETQ